MAIIEFDPYVLSNQSSNQSLTRWSQALHHASHDIADEQSALQLWKQQHKQGVFSAAAKFGFTGMMTRLQSQRRTNR
ncbi:MAG: hypothetical protein ABUL58_07220 [Steroidobacter sp.]